MSNSDQQHPYHPGPEQQPQYPDPQQYAYGQQDPQQQPPYPQQTYGQQPPHPQPTYGQQPQPQQPFGQQPYGQQAYGDPSHGDPSSYGDPSHGGQGYGGQGYADTSAGQADQGMTQTWQGQTWDTQYQPAIQPEPRPAPPADPAGPTPLPPQHASAPGTGSYPLPPEVRAAPAPVPAGAPGDDGYSAPTTLGNARITDAQRARAEGRSPIIAPGIQPAAITAGLGLLLALGAAIGSYALAVPLVLLQAVTAAGWFRLNGMWPARQGIALAFAGGLVADVALLAAGRENGPAAIIGTLGVWVLLTVVLQLRSRAGADERMQGLMATVASAALAVLAAGHLAAVPDAVTVGAVAVAAAVLVRALPLPGAVSVVAALVVAAGAGMAAGAATDLGAKGALLGLAAGVCALIGLRVASYDYPSRFVHMTAGVALPLTAAAPAVYLLGRVLT
ncbi:hypothetical protein E6P78_29485 [Streptomyces sp. A0958]|uniref:hypothetical protein n=1 Tax=Streptomyces sp. A0958 TaxID=2563101 RepID=UPI00109E503C|nr:hypothetical protein [Streptomyces sp. A0958]THA59442.1 hypothetical protein E6P78_29485 [Streptomyces sp. A0958]